MQPKNTSSCWIELKDFLITNSFKAVPVYWKSFGIIVLVFWVTCEIRLNEHSFYRAPFPLASQDIVDLTANYKTCPHFSSPVHFTSFSVQCMRLFIISDFSLVLEKILITSSLEPIWIITLLPFLTATIKFVFSLFSKHISN